MLVYRGGSGIFERAVDHGERVKREPITGVSGVEPLEGSKGRSPGGYQGSLKAFRLFCISYRRAKSLVFKLKKNPPSCLVHGVRPPCSPPIPGSASASILKKSLKRMFNHSFYA